MNAEQLFNLLSERNVRLWVEGGRLKFRAPEGALTGDLRSQLASLKEDMLVHLRERLSQDVTEYPSSMGQRALWFLNQIEPESDGDAYNIPFAAHIRSRVDVSALKLAFQALIDRHAVLRTTFASNEGEPVQLVRGYQDLSFEQIDVAGIDADQLRKRVIESCRQAFDLETGPVYRVQLYTRDETDHIISFAIHHIAVDGWSITILGQELVALYDAHVSGTPAGLPDIKASFVDYVQWQQEELGGTRERQLLTHWCKQLSGDLPILDIQTDRPRPPVRRSRGASCEFGLSAELTGRLQALAKGAGATLFMIVLAGFFALLHRYSGQPDILVGTPTHGRNRSDFASTVGYFVNMVVVRGDLQGDPSFAVFLEQIRSRVLDALEHDDLPFPLLVQHLQPRRDVSQTPIFQTSFALHQFSNDQLLRSKQHDDSSARSLVSGIELNQIHLPGQEGQFDLAMEIFAHEGALSGLLKYNTDLFDRVTIERMLVHFEALLSGAVANPEQPISNLRMMTVEERSELLHRFCEPPMELPTESLSDQFSAQVERTPDADAVVSAQGSLTYRQLDQRSSQLAQHLTTIGVEPGQLIGILLDRSDRTLVALLGVLKTGCAYLPLDPAYPPERLRFMLEDSQAPVLITEDTALGRELERAAAQTVYLDLDAESIARAPGHAPAIKVSVNEPLYVIYTSGSTGTPKGVIGSHRGTINRLEWMWRSYPFVDGEVCCQKTSLSFVDSVCEIFSPLLKGITTVLIPNDVQKDVAGLVGTLAENRVSRIVLVPSMLQAILDSGMDVDARLPCLRLWVTSGEYLSRELARRFVEAAPQATLLNLYGSSEVAADSTYYDTRGHDFDHPVPIGQPIANTQAYVLDGDGQLCPMGVPGELYIGGDGLAIGYLNREALTAERFVADPFSTVEGARMYRTGDRVRWQADGQLQYLQRLDSQVNLRGYRIELGEIESVLGAHEAVNSVVVVAHEMGAGDTRLVAYIVPEADGMDPSTLRDHLRGQLPDYMIPQHFMELDALPLLPNGKVDRKGLPEPGVELLSHEYVAPRSETEQRIASIWQTVLKAERVGIHDGFFDIGGHSLLAAAVMARLRDELGVELSLRQLFEAPTVARLAQLIEGEGVAEHSQVPALAPSTDEGPVPQSYAQQRLWYLDQLEPNTAVYNLPTALRLRGELDVDALRQALNEIVRRHEVLRTTLVAGEDGIPVQQVTEMLEFEVLPEELEVAAGEESASAVLRVLEKTSAEPFELASGPLIRVRLLRLADDDHVLQVVMHHAISDGWSLELFLNEMRALYAAFREDMPSPLAPLPVQYGDYARWQRDWLEGGELARQLEYWRAKFPVEPPALDLPTDRPRPAVQGYRGAAIRFALSEDLVTSLERLGRAQGATLFMVLLTAYKVLLARYTGQESLSVGTPIANRGQSQLEPLIGFFVNTLVMNTDLSGQPSFETALQRVQEICLGAYSHQDIPFERLVEAVNPVRDQARTPMFQTLFSYQDMSTVSLEMGEVEISPLELPVTVSRTDMTLWLTRGLQKGLYGLLEYSTDLFDQQTMEGLIERFQVLLEGIVASPQTRIGELPLLLADERARLVNEWNATTVDYPRESRLHDLIAAQAARTPDAIALEFADECLSYAELDERANEVACRLRGLGIEPAALVAVCLERSADMVVALLGVLKAGCAYLPLDPGFPSQRLSFIFEDAAVGCLLTTSSLRSRLPETEAPLLALDEAGEMVDGPLVSGTAEDLAYVIYTSGSTGQPKGVQVPHGTVVNLLTSMAQEPGFTADDTMLAVTTPAFDISVLEIFLPLMVGGRLVVAGSEDVSSADRLQDLLAGKDISVMQATPSTWRLLIDSGWTGAAQLKALCGGEALPQELATRIAERVGSLWNLYGPTETTIWSSVYRFESPTDPVYIGRPIANTQLYVLDSNGQLSPQGVPGELYIGGAGVTRGYLNRPELTADRFVADPFSTVEGAHLYRTGDRVRYHDNGMLEYLQRLDHQVKVRGYRIELGEIESVLGAHEAVNSVVVVAHEMGAGDTRLVAYWVGEKSSSETGTGLRAFLRERLPDYMIPQHFIDLDCFPLTPNGKVDRRALPNIYMSQETDTFVAPRTPTEKRIASIWEAVLKTDRVGIHDNFFDIGGHSLLAVQLVAGIKTEIGAEVTLRSLVSDTLGQVARDLEEELGEATLACSSDRNRWTGSISRMVDKFRSRGARP